MEAPSLTVAQKSWLRTHVRLGFFPNKNQRTYVAEVSINGAGSPVRTYYGQEEITEAFVNAFPDVFESARGLHGQGLAIPVRLMLTKYLQTDPEGPRLPRLASRRAEPKRAAEPIKVLKPRKRRMVRTVSLEHTARVTAWFVTLEGVSFGEPGTVKRDLDKRIKQADRKLRKILPGIQTAAISTHRRRT